MTTAAELETAVTASVASGDAVRDARVAKAAILQAFHYSPAAPADVLLEAAIRTAGWLRDVDPAFASVSLDGDNVEYRQPNGSALRNSGAQALLSPWRVRRARGGF